MILRSPDENKSNDSSPITDDKAASSPEILIEHSIKETATEEVVKEPSLAEVGQKAYEASVKDKQPASTTEEETAASAGLKWTPTKKAEGEKEVSDAAKTKEENAPTEGNDKGPVPYERFHEINENKKQFEEKIKEYEPMVQAHKSIVEYCQTNSISEDEFPGVGLGPLDHLF